MAPEKLKHIYEIKWIDMTMQKFNFFKPTHYTQLVKKENLFSFMIQPILQNRMRQFVLFLLLITMTTIANAQTKQKSVCTDDCEAKNKKSALTCKLSSPELRARKATVIKSLKSEMLQKKELTNGYSYKFTGTDKMVDELTEFVKTERACCDFFVFNLLISGDKSEAWLEITGPKGAKDFIKTELEL